MNKLKTVFGVRVSLGLIILMSLITSSNVFANETVIPDSHFGVTIITHGYMSDADSWVNSMAEAVRNRMGYEDNYPIQRIEIKKSGTDAVYVVDDKEITVDSRGAIVVVDWSDASTETGLLKGELEIDGTPTGLIAAAIKTTITDDVLEFPIHLIGHSRGASAMSGVAYSLSKRGKWVDHLTFLDPHPFDVLSSDDDFDRNDDEKMNIWENVIFADNYYNNTFVRPGISFVYGFQTLMNQSYQEELGHIGDDNDVWEFALHSRIHTYYHGTIDTSTTTDGFSDETIIDDWYVPYGRRDSVGFNLSKIVFESRNIDPFSLSHDANSPANKYFQGLHNDIKNIKYSTTFAPNRTNTDIPSSTINAVPNIGFIGANSYNFTIGEEIDIPYIYQDLDSENTTVILFLDNDRNPYNSGSIEIYRQDIERDFIVDESNRVRFKMHSSNAAWTPKINEIGEYYIGAKIYETDGYFDTETQSHNPGQRSYAYMTKSINIESGSVEPVLGTYNITPITIQSNGQSNRQRFEFTPTSSMTKQSPAAQNHIEYMEPQGTTGNITGADFNRITDGKVEFFKDISTQAGTWKFRMVGDDGYGEVGYSEWESVQITIDSSGDTTKPVITLNGFSTINLNVGDTYTEQGATCTDDIDENCTVVIGGDTVDTSIAGTYAVIYNTTDSAGNEANEIVRTVVVVQAISREWINLGEGPNIYSNHKLPMGIDNSGLPYVAYMDPEISSKARVSKFNGINWETIGEPISGIIQSIAVDSNDIPYVTIFNGEPNAYYLTVQKYENNIWDTVGSVIDSPYYIPKAVITFDKNNTPYISYGLSLSDLSQNEGYVKKFNGSAWDDVGSRILGTSQIYMNFDSTNTLNITYTDYSDYENTGIKTFIKKIDGNSWQIIGDGIAGCYSHDIKINMDNFPYILCSNRGLSVYGFNGTVWNTVGGEFSNGWNAFSPLLGFDLNNQLYVAYSNNTEIVVKKFKNNLWEDIRENINNWLIDLSSQQVTILFSNNIPYISYYTGGTPNGKIIVKKFVDTSTGDRNSPAITLNGTSTINLEIGDAYNEQGATCTNDIDTTCTVIIGGDPVDTNTAGTYIITYNATDAAGNSAIEKTRIVNISSNTIAVPPNPILQSPGTNNSENTIPIVYDLTPVLRWENAVNATHYTLSIKQLTNNSFIMTDKIVYDTLYSDTLGLELDTSYSWNIKACNGAVCSDASESFYFKIGKTPKITSVSPTPLSAHSTLNVYGKNFTEITEIEWRTSTNSNISNARNSGLTQSYNDSTSIIINNFGQIFLLDQLMNTSAEWWEFRAKNGTIASDWMRISTNSEKLSDTTSPVITLEYSSTINLSVGESYSEFGATCTDDTDTTCNVIIGGDIVNTNIAGTYTVTYNATDEAGNSATEVVRAVIVSALSSVEGEDVFLNNKNTGRYYVFKKNTPSTALETWSTNIWQPGFDAYPGDYNGDGRSDVFMYNNQTGRYFVFSSNGSGGLSRTDTNRWSGGFEVSTGDFNGDGKDDIYIYKPSTGRYFIFNTNTAGTNLVSADTNIWVSEFEPTIGDYNGDGRSDVFMYNNQTGRYFVFSSNGSGGLSRTDTNRWSGGFEVSTGDFNGDGKDDIYIYKPSTGRYFIFNTNTAGTNLVSADTNIWVSEFEPTIGDYNGDGRSDVFMYNNQTGRYFVFSSNGAGGLSRTDTNKWSDGFEISTGDFNGDEKDDIFIYKPSTGRYFIFKTNASSPNLAQWTSSVFGTDFTVSIGNFDQ